MYRRSSCSFGNLRCVFVLMCFGLSGGVVCPLVRCGVLVLLWECFVVVLLFLFLLCVVVFGIVFGLCFGSALWSVFVVSFVVWCFRTVVGEFRGVLCGVGVFCGVVCVLCLWGLKRLHVLIVFLCFGCLVVCCALLCGVVLWYCCGSVLLVAL